MDTSQLSDDDFLNSAAPTSEAKTELTEEEKAAKVAEEQAADTEAARLAQEEQDRQAAEAEAQRVADEQAAAEAAEAAKNKQPDLTDENLTDEQLAAKAAAVTVEESAKPDPTKKDNKEESENKDKETGTEPDYKAIHDKVMAPFVANGKTMQVKSAEEAIQLMQMGANYTRKMQELAPHRKTLLMLENNGLMDADKLAFAIDVMKGDPAAIQKLLKDAKVDVMNIDTEAESTYQGGNHSVTDDEVNFRTIADDLASTAVGKETLAVMNGWDQASKEVLWKQPEVMTAIHAQRESGVYARIVAEIDRRKTFGQIQLGVPFLAAYKQVGDELQNAGAFADLVPVKAPPVENKQPLVTKPVTKTPVVDPKVKAAATHQGAPKPSTSSPSMLDMSDEELLKLAVPK